MKFRVLSKRETEKILWINHERTPRKRQTVTRPDYKAIAEQVRKGKAVRVTLSHDEFAGIGTMSPRESLRNFLLKHYNLRSHVQNALIRDKDGKIIRKLTTRKFDVKKYSPKK